VPQCSAADAERAAAPRPQVTVPRTVAGLTKASFYVPAHDPALASAVEWSIDPPFKARV
jgi:hypothetical protein